MTARNGAYDKFSIMQYNFDKSLFKKIPGKVNPCIREKSIDNLSTVDIEGVRQLYGEPGISRPLSRPNPAELSVAREKFNAMVIAYGQKALMKNTPTNNEQTGDGQKAEQIACALQEVKGALDELENSLPPKAGVLR